MMRDPLLAALIKKLPPVGKPWPRADREVWLKLMRDAFDISYGRDTIEPFRFAEEAHETATIDAEPAPTRRRMPKINLDDESAVAA